MHKVRQVCLYVTGKCNLACHYCSIVGAMSKMPDMSTKKVVDALRIIHDTVDPEFLVLFGGEPFIRQDISEIVDEVNNLGFNYTLITNGTIDDEVVIRKLKGLTLSIDRPKQVMDSKDEKSKSNWDMLEKYKDIVPDLVANVTVTAMNIGQLEAIARHLNDLNIWTIYGLVHSKAQDDAESQFRSWCPQLAMRKGMCLEFDRVLQKTKKRHNSLMYGRLAPIYGPNLHWHCENNPKNPEYMTIACDGTLLACNDIWGEFTPKHTIFDIPSIGLDKWHKLCKLDRSRCSVGCFYNHELNLMYPDKDTLIHTK